MKHVLIIEDDRLQAGALKLYLSETYPGVEIRWVATELQFRSEVLAETPLAYSVAIVDMMLRWTDPSANMVMPPEEILQEGFFVAGLRCCRELRKRGIRCVIFTALDPEKVPLEAGEEGQIPIVNKSRGFEALQPHLKRLAG